MWSTKFRRDPLILQIFLNKLRVFLVLLLRTRRSRLLRALPLRQNLGHIRPQRKHQRDHHPAQNHRTQFHGNPFQGKRIRDATLVTYTTSSAGQLYQISQQWVYEIRRSTIQNSKKNLLEAAFIDETHRRAVSLLCSRDQVWKTFSGLRGARHGRTTSFLVLSLS